MSSNEIVLSQRPERIIGMVTQQHSTLSDETSSSLLQSYLSERGARCGQWPATAQEWNHYLLVPCQNIYGIKSDELSGRQVSV